METLGTLGLVCGDGLAQQAAEDSGHSGSGLSLTLLAQKTTMPPGWLWIVGKAKRLTVCTQINTNPAHSLPCSPQTTTIFTHPHPLTFDTPNRCRWTFAWSRIGSCVSSTWVSFPPKSAACACAAPLAVMCTPTAHNLC